VAQAPVITGKGFTPDPETLAKIGRLDLKARGLVEGFLSGMHRSPYLGSSVEFAQHRGYVPGDDLKHLDWKVWGKNERYYIRQYRAETNLVAWALVDCSASMEYAGSKAAKGQTKLEWARLAAAAVAWMVLLQSDAVGLCTFAGDVQEFVPRSSRKDHLGRMCDALVRAKGEPRTGLGPVLQKAAERMRSRGIVVLISDLFADLADLAKGLARLRHEGHDVIVVQVLDDDELHFPFEGQIQFHGLELDQKVLLNPRQIKAAYLDELEKHITAIDALCRRNGIDHILASTSSPVDVVLQAYFNKRSALSGAGARGAIGR
jgi:uncharacterized protein (DUF58 family)